MRTSTSTTPWLLHDPSNRIHRHAESTAAPYVIGRKGAGTGSCCATPSCCPRHLIAIVNRVFEAHAVDPRAPFPVSGMAVIEGVRRGQAAIVGDIIAAYGRVHPHADACCGRILPNVGLVLDDAELHRLYNRRGIRKATGLDYRGMRRVLIEIGCLGRVVEDDSTARYVVGEFEYTRPGTLHLAEAEQLCVHPLFGEVYSCRHSSSRRLQLTPAERRAVRPVYPVGSDPDANRDYRDAF